MFNLVVLMKIFSGYHLLVLVVLSRSISCRTYDPVLSSWSKDIDSPILRSRARPNPIGQQTIIQTPRLKYKARDVSYYLESHAAHSIHDPRVYFTEERYSRSLAIMLHDIRLIPEPMRFAYLVRLMNELGRKIVSKLNFYSLQVAAILRRPPDNFGSKPKSGVLFEAIMKAFNSKDDEVIENDYGGDENLKNPIGSAIGRNSFKSVLLDRALEKLAARFSSKMVHISKGSLDTINDFSSEERSQIVDLLTDSLRSGAKTFINELSTSDKFKVSEEVQGYARRILNMACGSFREAFVPMGKNKILATPSEFKKVFGGSFKDLNRLSDSTASLGAWNSYLFTNLESSERVVKVFASLLTRVPLDAKSRWINMYLSEAATEIQLTLPGFVTIQAKAPMTKSSEAVLLKMRNNQAKAKSNYAMDKERIPARCYLAGRRWRLLLNRSMQGYSLANSVISSLADKLAQMKLDILSKSKDEPTRLCLPRLEVGLRGWGINGDPQMDDKRSNLFPMKNPIQNLDNMPDPFTSGLQLGYKFGFKIGYNEERNATLELEKRGAKLVKGQGGLNAKSKVEVQYLARVCYRRATTEAAKRVMELAVREGYLMPMKISESSGIRIPAEAAARFTALRCAQLAGQVGQETGKAVAEGYLVKRELDQMTLKSLAAVGETHGLVAGQTIGRVIGAIVGKMAAEEAYKRRIARAGKLIEPQFHLEELESGTKIGFEFGLEVGKRIAASSTLDPSAPRFLNFHVPTFGQLDKTGNQVDHWEKDLMPPLSPREIERLSDKGEHIKISGSMRGVYKSSIGKMKGLERMSFLNQTMEVEIFAKGFMRNNIAYLTLNGTIDGFGSLHGSLVGRDLFSDNDGSGENLRLDYNSLPKAQFQD